MKVERLERYRRLLYSNAPLIGGWLRRKTVERLMKDGTPEAVRVLEEAAAHNGDEQIRSESMNALRRLAEQGDAEAQEALCRLAVFHDLPLARETALALSCAPRDASQRALFYFLTGQWDEYERLDFDHSLLRGAYNAGNEMLRQKIGERARGAGRVEWVEVVVGGRQGRQLGEVTDSEWEVTLEVLSGSGRWAEMWRLAQEAPARWSAHLLQRLSNARWVPERDADRAEYEELARLAGRWTETGLDSLTWCRAVLKGHEGPVDCLAISPNGQFLASGSWDRTVRLWNPADGTLLKTMEGHSQISCLAISPDGRMLADVGTNNGEVRLWSLPDGAPLKTLDLPYVDCTAPYAYDCDYTECIAFSLDGRILASGYIFGGMAFWSMPDGARLSSMEKLFRYSNGVQLLAFSPDGSALASYRKDCFVQLWSLRNGGYLSMPNKKDSVNVQSLAFSPDGRTLVGATVKTVCLWSLPDGASRWRQPDGTTRGIRPLPDDLPLKTLEGHESSITSLAISPDGRILASGSMDCTVRLWSMPDGAPLKILKEDSDPVYSLAFSPDGQTLASGGSSDGVVRLWSLNPFDRVPISQAGMGDMICAEKALRNDNLDAEQRNCLEFVAALIRLRRRFDIQLGEPARRIEAGEFDIEIEG